jgi:hypothetical protein
MKTIKDLFKYQPKIEHKGDSMSPRKQQIIEKKESKDSCLESI